MRNPRNQNRTLSGQYRQTKGTRRKSPVNQDDHDQAAAERAKRVYRGLGSDPRRQTYRRLYAELLRCEARCLRGWFDSHGKQKQAAAQFYALADRISAMEKDVAAERRRVSGNAEGKLRFVVVMDGSTDPDGRPRLVWRDGLSDAEASAIEREEAEYDARQDLEAAAIAITEDTVAAFIAGRRQGARRTWAPPPAEAAADDDKGCSVCIPPARPPRPCRIAQASRKTPSRHRPPHQIGTDSPSR